jgi:hypothetical protein
LHFAVRKVELPEATIFRILIQGCPSARSQRDPPEACLGEFCDQRSVLIFDHPALDEDPGANQFALVLQTTHRDLAGYKSKIALSANISPWNRKRCRSFPSK